MNKKALLVLTILLVAGLFITKPVFAGWTQAKGHAYNQLTYQYYFSDHKYSTIETNDFGEITGVGKNHRTTQAEFESYSLTYYGEYGIIDTLTVFTAIPYKWSESNDTIKYSGDNGPAGVGDIDFGLRYKLSDNLFGTNTLMSLQGTVKIPEAYSYGHPLEDLSLGDGQYDGTLALVFGRGFGKGYGILQLSYKYRFENNEYEPITFKPSDQIKVFIGGGYSIGPKLSLRGSIDWAKSIGNADVSRELVRLNASKYGGILDHQDHMVIRDTLGLEQNTFNLGVALAYSFTPQIQSVVSFNRDIGIFDLHKDAGQGNTYALAMVYTF